MSATETPAPLSNPRDLASLTECPLCHKTGFGLYEKKLLGIVSIRSWMCSICGATFKKGSRGTYRLTALANRNDPVWQSYEKQILTSREWETIGNGGMSDVKQKEADMEQWMTNLKTGKVRIQSINAPTSLILQKDEALVCALPNVILKEPRSVRTSRGSYGGPSFRVARGVYFRVGSFGSTTQSHSEIKNIDTGVLTVTNRRFAFAGGMKTVVVDLKTISSIDPFSDGIATHRDGYQKTQYFTWQGNIAKLSIGVDGRSYQEPFSGLILQYIIEGAAAARGT